MALPITLRILLALAVLFVSACKAGDSTKDEAAIRQLIDGFAKAENARDGERFAQLFAPGGDVLFQGNILATGPDQLRKILAAHLPWSEVGPANYNVQKIRLLKGEVAIADAVRGYYTPTMSRSSACTFILVKHDGHWLVQSYRNLVLSPTVFEHDSPFSRPAL